MNQCDICAQMERDIDDGCSCEYTKNLTYGHRWVRLDNPSCRIHKFQFEG